MKKHSVLAAMLCCNCLEADQNKAVVRRMMVEPTSGWGCCQPVNLKKASMPFETPQTAELCILAHTQVEEAKEGTYGLSYGVH